MFAIINDKNERISNCYTFKYVDSSKKHCLWKNESTALKVMNKLLAEGQENLSVINIDDEEVVKPKKEKDPIKEEEDVQDEEVVDEETFFQNGLNEKCLRCENDCKQSALAIIVRCPSFKKIKK